MDDETVRRWLHQATNILRAVTFLPFFLYGATGIQAANFVGLAACLFSLVTSIATLVVPPAGKEARARKSGVDGIFQGILGIALYGWIIVHFP